MFLNYLSSQSPTGHHRQREVERGRKEGKRNVIEVHHLRAQVVVALVQVVASK